MQEWRGATSGPRPRHKTLVAPSSLKAYPGVDPFARRSAVWRKSFVFSSLPIRKGLIFRFAGGVSPPFPVFSLLFSASYPQDRRSYYLFFNYLFFTTCFRVARMLEELRGGVARMLEESSGLG